MSPEEFSGFDATDLASLVRRREVHPRELVAAAIERIEAVNPRLNAVIAPMFDAARAAALARPETGPFAGVPFLVKDLLPAQVANWPLRNGSRFFRGFISEHDSELIARYRRAGLILLGKTNTPEFGLAPMTEPEAFGPTRNPWDLARTAGGSSGGAGAAVASGMVPMAHGGDGGGSIRIPASCCGLFGLKPSRGRMPVGPDIGEAWQGLVVEHVLTRSVRDSAAILDATSGMDPGAPYCAPPPTMTFAAAAAAAPGRLRIAFSARTLTGTPVHADCRAALRDAADLCASLGHHVEEAAPTLDGAALSEAFLMVLAAELQGDIDDAAELLGRGPGHDEIETATRLLALLGARYSATEFAVAVKRLRRAGRALARFLGNYDLMLTPTLAQPPLPHGALQAKGAELAAHKLIAALGAGRILRWSNAIKITADRIFSFIPFTPLANASGQPAMSVPLYWNADGLPIGVQFIARYGEETTLFSLAGQLEQARPWVGRRPPLA